MVTTNKKQTKLGKRLKTILQELQGVEPKKANKPKKDQLERKLYRIMDVADSDLAVDNKGIYRYVAKVTGLKKIAPNLVYVIGTEGEGIDQIWFVANEDLELTAVYPAQLKRVA